MKRKDIKKLQDLEIDKLETKLLELRKEFAKLRMDHRVGRLKNVRILSSLRDDTARVAGVISLKKRLIKV